SSLPLHLILGNDDAAFVADDGGVVRVLDGAARGARVPGNGGAPATPFAPGERVEARSGKRGRTARQRTAGAVGGAGRERRGGKAGERLSAGGRESQGHMRAGSMRGTSRWITVAASR